MVNDYLVDKSHVLIFKTASGELVVGTKSLSEVAQQPWFREFLNIGGQVQVAPPRDYMGEVARLEQEVRDIRMRQQQQPQNPQVVVQQHVQEPVSMQRRIPSSFLDVPPELMTRNLWESMTAEQQSQWQARYPPQ